MFYFLYQQIRIFPPQTCRNTFPQQIGALNLVLCGFPPLYFPACCSSKHWLWRSRLKISFIVPTSFFPSSSLISCWFSFLFIPPSSLKVKSYHQRCNYVYIGLYTIFNIHFLPSAQRKRPHAIPQTAECTDSTGLPQTPAGRARLKTRPPDAPDAPGLTLPLFLSSRSSWSTSETMT